MFPFCLVKEEAGELALIGEQNIKTCFVMNYYDKDSHCPTSLTIPSKVRLIDPKVVPQVKSTKCGFHGCCI